MNVFRVINYTKTISPMRHPPDVFGPGFFRPPDNVWIFLSFEFFDLEADCTFIVVAAYVLYIHVLCTHLYIIYNTRTAVGRDDGRDPCAALLCRCVPIPRL